MNNPPLSPEEAAKKARSKAAHRASMIGTGAWMAGCGLVAAYLAFFSKASDMPAFMYGHLSNAGWTGTAVHDPGDVLAVYARKDPAQAKSVLTFIERNMTRGAQAGYYTGVPGMGGMVGQPVPGGKCLARINGAIVSTILDYQDVLNREGESRALETLELWWNKGIQDGVVRRDIESPKPSGMSEDQLSIANAFAAAFEATRDAKHLERAVKLVDRDLKADPNADKVLNRILNDIPPGDRRRAAIELRLKN